MNGAFKMSIKVRRTFCVCNFCTASVDRLRVKLWLANRTWVETPLAKVQSAVTFKIDNHSRCHKSRTLQICRSSEKNFTLLSQTAACYPVTCQSINFFNPQNLFVVFTCSCSCDETQSCICMFSQFSLLLRVFHELEKLIAILNFK